MLEFLAAPEAIAFTAALVLMLLIGLVEALGLGASGFDADLGLDVDGGLLGWLGFGRVPLLVLLVAFLAAFGVIGFAGQQAAAALTGGLLPAWIAAPVAALPATALLGRVMPHDETTAYDIDDLTGRAATITVAARASSIRTARRITSWSNPTIPPRRSRKATRSSSFAAKAPLFAQSSTTHPVSPIG